jgi:hypothetical protein
VVVSSTNQQSTIFNHQRINNQRSTSNNDLRSPPLKVQAVELVDKGSPAQVEQSRGLTLVATSLFEAAQDQLALEL